MGRAWLTSGAGHLQENEEAALRSPRPRAPQVLCWDGVWTRHSSHPERAGAAGLVGQACPAIQVSARWQPSSLPRGNKQPSVGGGGAGQGGRKDRRAVEGHQHHPTLDVEASGEEQVKPEGCAHVTAPSPKCWLFLCAGTRSSA